MVITTEGIGTKGCFVEAQVGFFFPDEAKVEELRNLLKEKQIGVVGVLTSTQNHWVYFLTNHVGVYRNPSSGLFATSYIIWALANLIEASVVIMIFSFFWKDKNQNLQVHQGVVRSIMDDVGYTIMKMGSVYVSSREPQDVVATEAQMNAMKEKPIDLEAVEPKPEPTIEVFFLCSYEGCGKTFIDVRALRKYSHIHGER
ncbi:unnamed protein product [Lactuca virosa]|uniref:C2H2-type domain-containing protein n=1 Tax=Lactuca virosa TaxID=75947 RepID=A0AAU9PPM3_9ASTR|nr:unnamed protein product [Lactuca virosa]